MAVPVPKSDKIYTTVYDNFRGVDFTNDASNVFRRRSPGGKNMLPLEDGRPYKRHGWKIVNPKEDFLSGTNQTEYVPKRIHHFSLGGEDYMVFFNSLGVFFKSEKTSSEMPNNVNGIAKIKLASGDLENPTLADFPPTIEGEALPADSGRAFFFEGNGTAGFYVFVGTNLYRFDGRYFWYVDPYVPKVLIACDKYGAGTPYEPVNLLTRKRTIQYLCDGESTQYVVPGGVQNNVAVIEQLQVTGDWQVLSSGYSISNGVITFTTPPPVVVEGEDNMRVTYISDGGYVIVNQEESQSSGGSQDLVDSAMSQIVAQSVASDGTATMTVERTRKRSVTVKFEAGKNKVKEEWKYGSWSGWTSLKYTSDVPATIQVVNITDQLPMFEYLDRTSGEYTPLGSDTAVTPTAYADKYTVQPSHLKMLQGASMSESVSSSKKWDGKSYKKALEENEAQFKKNKKVKINKVTGTETETETTFYTMPVRANYDQFFIYSASTSDAKTVVTESFDYIAGDGEYITHDASAFAACQRTFVYGSGLYNQVFYSASTMAGYNSRVWYSMASDPTYVPDTNYIEAGGDDTHIVGMMKVSGYVGIIKQGSAMDASVYLAYPTSFETDTTFAVMQSINGVGALSNGAFNILNAEPLYLSKDGVMGIEVSETEVDRKVKSRSYYINKALTAEQNLADAVSFVHKNLYYLALNGHVYVLDGSQKNSWANEKTNLQYECYYLENVPAQCFSAMDGVLYFMDYKGNLCKFKESTDEHPYRDEYSLGEPVYTMSSAPVNGQYDLDDFEATPAEDETIKYGDSWYTVTSIDEDNEKVNVGEGVPIVARWDTIADDDGAVHFFKNLQKKGCVVSLLPDSDSGVKVYLKPDEREAVKYGETDVSGNLLPSEHYIKKKIKKYKRLQIICVNDGLDQGFGVDQIIKSYTMGNYSKNRK